MKEEFITKEEWEAVGFAKTDLYHLALGIENTPLCITLSINHEIAFLNEKNNQDGQLKRFPATKENINEAYRFFSDKDLDFTPKQKDYSWEAVLGRTQSEKYCIAKDIEKIETLIEAPESLKRKLIALLKLHYIIEELDRDFEGNKVHRGWVYWSLEKEKLKWDYSRVHFIGEAIRTASTESAKILIDNHAQLLKDALGVK